jgi:hypothetical protein
MLRHVGRTDLLDADDLDEARERTGSVSVEDAFVQTAPLAATDLAKDDTVDSSA